MSLYADRGLFASDKENGPKAQLQLRRGTLTQSVTKSAGQREDE